MPEIEKIYLCKKCKKEFTKDKLAKGIIPIHQTKNGNKMCNVQDRSPDIK